MGNAPKIGSTVFYNTTIYYLPSTAGWDKCCDKTFAGRPMVIWKPQTNTTAKSK